MVRAPDGCWVPAVVPVDTSRAAKDQGVALTDAQVTAIILDQFVTLWDEYKADRALVPKGNLHEVAYADLAADPVGEVRRLYAALGLPGFNTLRPRLAAHFGARGAAHGYKTNRFNPLAPELEALVRERWADFAAEYGYE